MEASVAEPEPAGRFSLSLLEMIRSAQQQNGLKHGDYERYRHFCARKLKALYKALKMQHGRTKYIKRNLEEHMVTDSRHLQVPLFSAERAWAYAMELKKATEERMDLRKRHHLVRRLAKAAKWAGQLAALAAARADTRSGLEAEAYASWMRANVLLEKESDWDEAAARFGRAKKLFQELGKVGELEQQALCGQMVEEIEPSIRYCNYQISRRSGGAAAGRPGADADSAALLDMSEHGRDLGLLQSKLASLAEEARSQQTTSTSYLEWRGAQHPARHEKVRLALAQARELELQLLGAPMEVDGSSSGAGGAGGEGGGDAAALDGKLPLYDKLINCYNEARGQLKIALQAAAGGDSGAQVEELRGLDAALSGTLLERTLECGAMKIATAEARFAAAQRRLAQGARPGAAAAGKTKDGASGSSKHARPEDLVRLLETQAHHCNELAELAGALGGRRGEELMDVCAAKALVYSGARTHYLAHVHLLSDKPLEALALFQRAAQRLTEAAQRFKALPAGAAGSDMTAADIDRLLQAAQAYRGVAHAELVASGLQEQQAVRRGIAAVSLTDTSATAQPTGYLIDHLDSCKSFAGEPLGRQPRLFEAPYALELVATRPIMLDTAANAIQPPSLTHRLKAKPAATTFSRLFGWRS